MIVRDRDKGSNSMNWAQHGSSPWTDERFHYLHLSIQIVTIVSLICATSEIVFGCWSLNILSSRMHGSNNSNQDRGQINPSTKSKHVVIGVALFLGLGARIAALLFWIRSTRNENLRCYSVTSHCTFVSVFVSLGLGCLLLYFVTVFFDSNIGGFRPNREVLLAFVYISGFDILFTSTFGFAVASDLQSKIRNEWRSELSLSVCHPQGENWVRPSRVSKLEKSTVTEMYV